MEAVHGDLHTAAVRDVPLEHLTEDGQLRIFGFWIFIVSDLILFSTLFATFAVLRTHVAGGPGPAQLFDVGAFTAETLILLIFTVVYLPGVM